MKRTQLIISAAVAAVCLGVSVPALARIDDQEFESIVNQEVGKDSSIKDLNAEIEDKASEVRELEERREIYEENIEQKQREKLTLQSQLSLIEDTIEQTRIDIERKAIEIEVTQLEIEVLKDQIEIAEQDIERDKVLLDEILEQIYASDTKTPVEITFGSDSFSEFYSDLEYTGEVQENLQVTLDSVQNVREELETKREELRTKKAELSAEKETLEVDQENLAGEEAYKQQLLNQTEQSEEKFQVLLDTVRQEQQQIEGSISTLEKSVQDKILNIRQDIQNSLDDGDTDDGTIVEEDPDFLNGIINFSWPIDSRIVTCGFHCDGYPFARWFQHSGMDIATPMGSPVRSTASGYVAIAKFDGTSNYAYIMVVHGNGLASVYGHVSCVTVSVDQYVQRGQQIGCSGGMPGTPGAGAYSTGAHLHFEIRVDGIPTNPMNYLPPA
jgi:murein DD-endopeptidase MepM/ murein hydrolase activator NlpD